MKHTDTVIFDLDGTLLDTITDLHRAVNHTLHECGFPERSTNDVRRALGYGYRFLLEQCLPQNVTEHDITNAVGIFEEFYNKHSMDFTYPYDKILPMLETLKNADVKMAIVSNKGMAAVERLAKHFFAGYVETAIGESATVRRKPAPDTVIEALQLLGSAKDTALYVGDSEVDIATAQNAGIECLSVSWGFRSAEYLKKCGAKHIIDAPMQLPAFLTE